MGTTPGFAAATVLDRTVGRYRLAAVPRTGSNLAVGLQVSVDSSPATLPARPAVVPRVRFREDLARNRPGRSKTDPINECQDRASQRYFECVQAASTSSTPEFNTCQCDNAYAMDSQWCFGGPLVFPEPCFYSGL